VKERWTVLKLLKWTTDYFAGRGIESARLEAELLLAATLAMDRVGLYVNFEQPLAVAELADYRAKVRRRAAHEPVQYILGETEFWSLPLRVTPQVLIPRADTEVLVEEALARLDGATRVLDVGTGSGAIAVALAHEVAGLELDALDCSREALAIARENAARNGVAERLHPLEGDLDKLSGGPYDMIVSNPPYIPTTDLAQLAPEVRDFEPRLALDGGRDGLEAYRRLAAQAGPMLRPGGWLLVEVGIGQAEEVSALFRAAGLEEIAVRDDYAGIARVVAARNPH
jgi:release factor glutamine methyltransferase